MKNKHIVITGASSGFGAEMAKLFAKDGHNLTLIARRVELIKDLDLSNVLIKKVDVTNFDEFNESIKEAEEMFGPVDLLVNNAGVMQLGQMGEQSRNEYNTMIDVNIKGVINGIETVVNKMKKRREGTIINVSSIAGNKAFANHAVYCGTKFAVKGITETLRQELAPFNVRVTNISPGAFATELLGHTTNEGIVDGYEDWKNSMGKMAKPIEVAKIIKYVFDAPQELNIREISLHTTKQVD
ncbi:SDR family oxidoreductase [Mycoplasma marinum]|uniref:Oxidoreductase n=1 Tax=Mycoplasma marinum TaxID=1937190 RepID=A0A4R0XUU5_9MOLU|nr:SDR family oxidoreductase [Mycoplasma marinum]TCG11469.1 oxidoreductase [Mycoplasma marinum]